MIEKFNLKEMLREIAEELGEQEQPKSGRISQDEIKKLLNAQSGQSPADRPKNESES